MIIIYEYFKPLDSGKWDYSFTVYWPQFSLSYYALSSRYFTEIVEKKSYGKSCCWYTLVNSPKQRYSEITIGRSTSRNWTKSPRVLAGKGLTCHSVWNATPLRQHSGNLEVHQRLTNMKFFVTLARFDIKSYDVLTMLLWKIKSVVSRMSFDEFDNAIISARLNACLSLRIVQRITLKSNREYWKRKQTLQSKPR